METEPMVSPQSPKGPVSQEDCGLWMEVGCKPTEDTDMAKDNSSLTSGEKPCEAWQAVIPPPPLVSAGHPDRMEEDEYVFILPRPCKDPSCPEEGSTMEPNVGAISVTEAKENPRSLDGVQSEQPSSTPVMDKATVTVEEEQQTELKKGGSENITVLTERPGSVTPPPTDGYKAVGASSPEQPHPNMETSILKETDSVPSSQTRESEPEHSLDNNSHPTHEGTIIEPEHTDESNNDVEDMVDGRSLDYDMTKDEWVRRDSASSDVQCLQPHLSISRGLSREQVLVPSPQSPASEQQEQQEVSSLTVAEDIQQGEQLLHRLHLVQQRQDGQQVPQEPPPAHQVAMKTTNQDTGYQEVEQIECRKEEEEEEEGGSEGSGEEREQGERVQTVEVEEREQGERVQTVEVEEREQGERVQTVEVEEREQVERVQTVEVEEREQGERVQTVEVEERAAVSEEDTEIPEKEHIETVAGEKAEEVQSCPSAQLSVQPMVRIEMECSDDDQSDSGVSTDFSPVSTHEIHTTTAPIMDNKAPPPQKETPIEREIRRSAEREQSLRRSRCMSNTQEGQEVVDIPLMKTPLLAKTLSSKAGPGQGADWQFSEKKMQKEISQEIHRELVLVNMGKIPGVYSKGTVRQMSERKLLFEAFQQGNAEGPTRHRRPLTTAGLGMRGHVYPSVLERTRSMELVSVKGCPLSRAHSHQLFDLKAQKEASSGQNPSAENQPATKGAARKVVILESDDTIIAHYPNRDRGAQRLYRSLDCLSIGGTVSTEEEHTDEVRVEQPGDEDDILRENPFFKLRPSLAMKPEVERDIREAREREEELRRQRCSLYGEAGVGGGRPDGTEDPSPDSPTTRIPSSTSSFTASVDGRQSKGKLDRTWPPPNPKSARMNPGQTQEPKVYKAGGQKTPLWQRWEAGMVNGPLPREQD
ncbi:cyclic nucleotide-gated cation channel beta-1-like isoform X3 [Oncorhynchus keta]|uniref:cyclic nucleotide-gated cation channel beta-1-like isoform X3 n=1 Tax=Oncorhynchus keta TaxID=8018 RepID=UPI00227A6BE7|nr:cyclic nucleotide-gated cation channel beta-1-like isoform X3 [Oncorhynchus keta]